MWKMNVWIHITAGQGPAECQWAVARLTERFQHEAAVEGIGCRVLDVAGGEEAHTARSALLALETPSDNLWLRSWIGTVQWIGRSP